MSMWLEKKVKELCIIGRGRVISQTEINSKPGVYPVFSSQTANNGEMGKIETYDFDGEYVTWTTDGANAGTVFYRSGKFNCTNVCGTLKEKEDDSLDLKFFSYLLSTEAKNHVSYLGNPKLMNGIMAEIKLNLPKNKPEQTRIAEILSTADEAISHTEALIAKYQRIKTGLMQDLLTKGIDEHGNIRSKAAHKFVLKNGIEVPEDWKVEKLGNICEKISDGAHQGIEFDLQGEIPFLFVSCIKENEILWENCSWVNHENYSLIAKGKEPAKGMVLYSVVGSYGNAVTIESNKSFTFQRHIAFMFPIVNILNSNYLTLFLNSEKGKRIANDLATGNAQKTITLNALRSFNIPLPKIEEQIKIENEFATINKIIIDTKNHLNKIQSLKTGLMQDLLSGKVRVKTFKELETKNKT